MSYVLPLQNNTLTLQGLSNNTKCSTRVWGFGRSHHNKCETKQARHYKHVGLTHLHIHIHIYINEYIYMLYVHILGTMGEDKDHVVGGKQHLGMTF